MSAADMTPDLVLIGRQQAIVQKLQARIGAALALHPRVLTDNGYLPEPVWFCTADHERWPCANVRALTGEQ